MVGKPFIAQILVAAIPALCTSGVHAVCHARHLLKAAEMPIRVILSRKSQDRVEKGPSQINHWSTVLESLPKWDKSKTQFGGAPW